MASKIPETEWSAIVARRESGEPIAAIAKSYDCSPALIYGVLKKAQAAAQSVPAGAPAAEAASAPAEREPTPEPQTAAAPAPQPAEPPAEPVRAAAVSEKPPVPSAAAKAPLGIGRPNGASSGARPSAAASAEDADEGARKVAQPAPHPSATKPIALTANLDQALRRDVDSEIDQFRAAFDAALGSANEETLETLRRASADLMRAGARTSIVVERLIGGAAKTARRATPTVSEPAVQPARARVSEAAPSVNPGDAVAGTVKWFNPEKRFGFVKLDGTAGDVFVHAQALERSGLGTLQEGQRVRLTTRPGPKGPQADRVELT
jgi:cold shock CspA family protein